MLFDMSAFIKTGSLDNMVVIKGLFYVFVNMERVESGLEWPYVWYLWTSRTICVNFCIH